MQPMQKYLSFCLKAPTPHLVRLAITLPVCFMIQERETSPLLQGLPFWQNDAEQEM